MKLLLPGTNFELGFRDSDIPAVLVSALIFNLIGVNPLVHGLPNDAEQFSYLLNRVARAVIFGSSIFITRSRFTSWAFRRTGITGTPSPQ